MLTRAGLVALLGGLAVVAVPIVHRILVVGRNPWEFCLHHAPDGIPLDGEGIVVTRTESLIPFGVECRYGDPVVQTVLYEFSTPLLIVGLASLAIGVVSLAVRLTVFRNPSGPGSARSRRRSRADGT